MAFTEILYISLLHTFKKFVLKFSTTKIPSQQRKSMNFLPLRDLEIQSLKFAKR
jgi:hypothetical protein